MEQENGWQKFCHHMWCFQRHSTPHPLRSNGDSNSCRKALHQNLPGLRPCKVFLHCIPEGPTTQGPIIQLGVILQSFSSFTFTSQGPPSLGDFTVLSGAPHQNWTNNLHPAPCRAVQGLFLQRLCSPSNRLAVDDLT